MDYFILLCSIILLVYLVLVGVMSVKDFITVLLIVLSYILGKNAKG